MNRVYEIFEVPPNGYPQRVTVVPGLEFAKITLQALAKRTQNECFAADAKTRQLVMQLNVPSTKLRRIFQITYDEELGTRRAELLRSRGYSVISVIGNVTIRTTSERVASSYAFLQIRAIFQVAKIPVTEPFSLRHKKSLSFRGLYFIFVIEKTQSPRNRIPPPPH